MQLGQAKARPPLHSSSYNYMFPTNNRPSSQNLYLDFLSIINALLALHMMQLTVNGAQ